MKENNIIRRYSGFITLVNRKPVMVASSIDVLEYLDPTAIVSIVKQHVSLGTTVSTSKLFGDEVEKVVPTDDNINIYTVILSNGLNMYLDKNPLDKPKKKSGRPSKKAKEEQANG